jgi:hypothetical protein
MVAEPHLTASMLDTGLGNHNILCHIFIWLSQMNRRPSLEIAFPRLHEVVAKGDLEIDEYHAM